MRGRFLIIGAGVLLAAFAGALWYFQNYAFYAELPQEPLRVAGTSYPVEGWEGIDASSSPLKKRVCLTLSADTAAAIASAHPAIEDAEPLVAPYWFKCFDAKQMTRDIAADRATAHLIGPSGMDGADDYIVVYPDGRAYIWSALQPEFQ